MRFIHLNNDGSRDEHVRFQIKSGDPIEVDGEEYQVWQNMAKGEPKLSGWLYWEAIDGSTGWARPEDWRVKH